jgi:hypothetical protein
MEYLFDSQGRHIANLLNGQLHAPNGQNVGHFKDNERIIIDMAGRYLGEIVHKNRLLYRSNSPYQSVNYGNFGNYGNVGNYGNPGNYGSIGQVASFREVKTPWLNE